jgi:hypothetical protein
MSFLTKEKTNWKYIAIIIIITVAITRGVWVWQRVVIEDIDIVPVERINDIKEAEFVDWEIYRNEEYGFEFKYPPYMGNISISSPKLQPDNINFELYTESDYEGYEFKLEIIKYSDEYTVRKQWPYYVESCIAASSEEDTERTTINGIETLKIRMIDCDWRFDDARNFFRVNFAYLLPEGKTYSLQIHPWVLADWLHDKELASEEEIFHREIFEKILSTFKFLY